MNEYGTFHQSPESHDTEYTPHDGVSMEHVRECLETACHEVQSLQAQQMEELMNLINKKALELAQVMHSEEMQRLRLTMRNRRVSDDVKEVARKKLQEHVNEARGLIMQTVSVKPEVSDSVQNVRDKVDSIIADKRILIGIMQTRCLKLLVLWCGLKTVVKYLIDTLKRLCLQKLPIS